MSRKAPILSFRGTFLSNFYPVTIHWQRAVYPCLENAYVAAKIGATESEVRSAPFGSPFLLACMKLRECRPGDAKRLGRNFEAWPQSVRRDRFETEPECKIRIMRGLLRQKFGPDHPELVDQLITTNDAELVEGNTWGDTFWGMHSASGDFRNGSGLNMLGKLLMERRTELLAV